MTIFLFLVCLICLIGGLIKPDKIILWKQPQYRTRKNVLKYFGTVAIVLLILIGVFNPSNSTKTNTNVASNKTETVDNSASQNETKTEVEQPKEVKRLGWTQESGNWYYYDNNGKLKTGWLKDNNKNYYLNSLGIMQKGWIKDNGKDYYLDNSGVMQTGWKESNGKWYYLNSDGLMATNTTVDGYYLASNGAMQEKSVNAQSNTNNNSNSSSGSTDNQSQTAYLSATGKKYHSRPNFGNMNPNKATKTTVGEAEKEGYGRCSKCW